MPDFWRNSGYHLLERREDGRLAVTDAFLRAYLMRPEVRPVEESCAAERALHESLLDDPHRPVAESEIAGLADPDAQDNYRIVLAFRDRLVAAGTVEDCYLGLFLEPGAVPVPPLFVDQLAHVIVRGLLEGVDDGLRARAGELFFREQAITINEGFVMAADAETVDMYATSGGFGDLGRLIAEAQTPLRTVNLDVLDETNAELYWSRDEAHDTVLNLNFAGAGLDAVCRLLESWVRRFLGVGVSIQPVQQIRDERWVWHVGLDQEGTAILNDLYNREPVGEGRLARLLALFRLELKDPGIMPKAIAGRPVYLAMAMTEGHRLRLKPQNLLVNLPIAEQG